MTLGRVPKWVWAALGMAVTGALLVVVFSDVWPLTARCTLTACEEGREWLLAIVTSGVFLTGLYQYRRAQQWERAKFLADAMKAFMAAQRVQNALTMIDWSERQINLYGDPNAKNWPRVTRLEQTRALLPHKVDDLQPHVEEGYVQAEGARDSNNAQFTDNDAAIRDCFDALLDGLEQFASYVETGLMGVNDLRPYLDYWIKDITAVTGDPEDDQWTAALLSYIDFYGYRGVQALFQRFEKDIVVGHKLYDKFLTQMSIVDRVQLKAIVLAERGETEVPTAAK